MGVDPNNVDSNSSIICPPSGHFSTAITIEDFEEDTGIHNLVVASSFSTLVSDSTQCQTIVQNMFLSHFMKYSLLFRNNINTQVTVIKQNSIHSFSVPFSLLLAMKLFFRTSSAA
jgi:hypothetical protein